MEHPPNNIDDLLRRRLEHAEVPPPAFVWPNVERALRQRKRRLFVWFFAVGLAGAGISAAIWNQSTQAPIVDLPGAAPAHPAAISTPKTVNRAPFPGVNAGQAAPQVPVGTGNAPVVTDRENTAAPAAPTVSRPVAKTRRTGRLADATVQPRNGSNAAPNFGSSPLAVTSIRPGESAPADERTTGINPVDASSISDLGQSEKTPEMSRMTRAIGYLPGQLATLDRPLHAPAIEPIQLPVFKKKAARKCYDFHANRQAWLVDAYAGPSLARKRLDTSNPEFRDYIADREGTEHHELAFNAGIRASYLFAENFLVRAGLHYDQFTEKFEYIDPNYIKYTVEITQRYQNGQWISVPDTVKVEYGANYVKTYNRFGLLDIPLQAALELRSGATGISLNLGGSLNMLFWKRGSMLALDGQPVSFTPKEHQFDVFRPRVGLSLLGSIQWFIHIGPQTRVFAEPYYRYIMEPVTQAGYPVKQAYGIDGIRFGVTRIVDRK